MNPDELKRVIIDQEEEIEEIMDQEKIISREIPDINNYLREPNILAITGVRRCGKSIASHLILKGKTYGYLNFDDERLIGLESEDLNKVLEAIYELKGDADYFIFDEIQNVDGWELFITRMRRTKRVIITGSSAELLSSELSTHLTGRHIDFNLHPFSFFEFLKYNGIEVPSKDEYSTKKISKIKKNLNHYMELGGFPESYKFGKHFLRRIYEDIIVKDAIARYSIRNKKTFREMAKFLVSNYSNEVTYSSLKEMTDIKNVHTVKDYVKYLESIQIVFLLQRFSFSLKKQMIAPKKVYCVDPGILDSIAFAFSEDKGRLLENVVAVELNRRNSYWFDQREIYYWKDERQREVDFVVKEGKEVEKLIQVCYDISTPKTREREKKSLGKASEALECENLKILTWDEQEELEVDGKEIEVMPVWRWLLERRRHPSSSNPNLDKAEEIYKEGVEKVTE